MLIGELLPPVQKVRQAAARQAANTAPVSGLLATYNAVAIAAAPVLSQANEPKTGAGMLLALGAAATVRRAAAAGPGATVRPAPH